MRDLSLFTAIKPSISSRDIVFYIKISYLNSRDKLTLNNQVYIIMKNRNYLYERTVCYRKDR